MPRIWFTYSLRNENDFEDGIVESCFLTQVYYYSGSRNTWMGRRGWYPDDDAFSLDVEVLKLKAERNRERGTHFSIEAIPTLAIAGRFQAVLISQFQSKSPFDGFAVPTSSSLTLAAIAQAFEPAEKDAWFRFVVGAEEVRPAELPFWSFESRSRGVDRSIDWFTKIYPLNLVPITQLVADITCRLQARFQ